MRNPDRLDGFYKELCDIHKTNFPDWRFGQFMINFLTWLGYDPFYTEEDKMMSRIKEFAESVK